MSGPPKRSHEEISHPISSKRPHEDIILLPSHSGKIVQQASSDYHPAFDPFPDGRMAKIPKTDPRDVDRTKIDSRLYRIPSPANGSYLDHTTDPKDGRDAKPDIRESKAEAGELAVVARIESQSIKLNRPESRPEDKDSRFERDSRADNKGETRLEKDSGSSIAASLSHVRDLRDQQRPKRFPEPSVDIVDPWRAGQHMSLHTDESGKEARAADALESWDAHDTAGDHRMEMKSEEKFKEKERKRKEEKYRDWGDRDKDRNDRYNLYPSSSNKESARQDRDVDRWDRERKETQKSKESKDKDKDSLKKMPFNLHDKESVRAEKDVADSSLKPAEQELATSEPKRAKEFDTIDRDGKEKRKEGSHDMETDRQDKRSRYHDKELDDGFGEEGNAEREREVSSASTQNRRIARRQRGSSQAMHREARNRSRSREHEGSQEKPEVSYITYKVGDSMQEVFLKAWKEYEANHENKRDESLQSGGPMLEIRIPAEYVIATNRQVRGGQLWGTDIYTDDSDLVAVLMHTGYCRPSPVPLPVAIHELRASIQVLPPQDCYASTLRNNVRSRAWGDGIKCSFRVVKCCFFKWQKGGGAVEIEPRLNHISAVEPTLAPVSVERTMTTRAAASNALRQQRFVREVTVQYNLCNEPWLKYSINVVADKGLKKLLYTSARLKKGEVLYLETHSHRFEICFNGQKVLSNGMPNSGTSTTEYGHRSQHQGSHLHFSDRNNECNNIVDVFRWSRCKRPLPQERMRAIGIPLPVEHLEVLEESLEWEDIQWSQTGVWVAGKEYVLARVHFLAAT